MFIADTNSDEVHRAAKELGNEGLVVHPVDLDVTQVDQVREVVSDIDARIPLGTVVNNAGVGWASSLLDVTPGQYDSLMAVNVRAVFFVLQAAARAMAPRKRGQS